MQKEIEKVFGVDKQGQIKQLRDAALITTVTSADGRLRFAVTDKFLKQMGVDTIDGLRNILEQSTSGGHSLVSFKDKFSLVGLRP